MGMWNNSNVASNLELNDTEKNIKSKLDFASFLVLHGKVDSCAVVQHDRPTIDLHAVVCAEVIQTVRPWSRLLVRPNTNKFGTTYSSVVIAHGK